MYLGLWGKDGIGGGEHSGGAEDTPVNIRMTIMTAKMTIMTTLMTTRPPKHIDFRKDFTANLLTWLHHPHHHHLCEAYSSASAVVQV